jgi:hypothetical protein
MRVVWRSCAGLLLAAALGCGSRGGSAVTGKVTLNGTALANAMVTFYPEGPTGGLGGSGRTDAEGKYTLTAGRGGKNILPGEYRVVISRPLNPDGSAPDPNVPPIESQARETLPPNYSHRDSTTLRATVTKEAKPQDFALEAPAGR